MTTYSVPHDNIDVGNERAIDVLRHVDVDEVTEMMIHVDA